MNPFHQYDNINGRRGSETNNIKMRNPLSNSDSDKVKLLNPSTVEGVISLTNWLNFSSNEQLNHKTQ